MLLQLNLETYEWIPCRFRVGFYSMKKILGFVVLSFFLSSSLFAGVTTGYKLGKGPLKVTKNTADILRNFKTIVVCEINNGQFVNYLRMKYPQFKYKQFNHIQGLPFQTSELKEHFNTLLS